MNILSRSHACHFGLLAAAMAGLLCTLAPSVVAASTTQKLFERTRPSVVEVLTKTRGNQGVAAAASGFLVQQSNWLITNYHAVTEVVFAPDEHELGVVTHDQQRIAAQVIAVDVRHDLALLQLQTPLRAPVLALREQWPAKGEAGYSMGKPGHYQHSIVSGTFNGVIDETTTPQLVFSGAINPGMSGGPTLDTQGRVVGINVASSTENQLLGLAVPAQALGALLRRTTGQAIPGNGALRQDIARQFAAYGQVQLAQMDQAKQPLRQLGPFQVQGDLAADKECQTARQQLPEHNYRMLQQRCDSPSGLYIMPKLYAGQMVSGAFWLQGKGLGSYAMSRLMERRLNQLAHVHDEESPPGRWQCSEQRLRGPGEVPIQLHACRRRIEKLPGLSDFRFRYTPLIGGRDGLIVAIGLSGYDNATAQAVLRRSIAALRTPAEQTP